MKLNIRAQDELTGAAKPMRRSARARAGRGIWSGWWSALRKKISRTFTRGPALFRRMGIPMNETNPKRRGLIIIQIDGLSWNRFQKALRGGKLRYVRKLLRRKRLKAYRYLSEIPTSTPAFQGGMFYGTNDNIPGFHFYDKKERRAYYMGQSDCAYAMECGFSTPGLLKGGSVYSCVYTGGAEASLFIFSSLTAPHRWRFALRLWDIFLLTLINLAVIFHIVALALVELGTGLWDLVKRVWRHGRVMHELEQLAIRIGLSVIGRELITLGAMIDISRQVPTIYLNYLGYDEHAHLRGPDSRFAMWSLRAIDRCIRRIYLAAMSAEREYDVYILSDHGQCASRPFEELTGESLSSLLRRETALSVSGHEESERSAREALQSADAMVRVAQSMPRPFRRPMNASADYLRRKTLERMHPDSLTCLDLSVFSTGPIAYVYWTSIEEGLSDEEIEYMHPGLLERLAGHRAIGFVSVRTSTGDVRVLARAGSARLLASGEVEREGKLPFDSAVDFQHVVSGIRRITLYPRSGDICVWGGGSSLGDVTFADQEYGSHSGWTNEEVEAMILAPASVDHDFSSIRRHSQFYDFFYSRYADALPDPASPVEPTPASSSLDEVRVA